ncbi:hypothetical protein CDL15_Pgr008583 [Punica granatum]|uniref:Transcription repressor n=1 Tax=Punica granatum TaxID=22663 RepID=A0A218WP65_PUNGR|nr:hypothetical protein CDL15_Pgr008583 [Punica granatum]
MHTPKMSNILWKNFHLCFSSLKCLPPPLPYPPSLAPQPPISEHQRRQHPPTPEDHASAATPTSVLIKNFNSLYDITSSENSTTTSNCSTSLTPFTADDPFFSSSSEDSDFADVATASPPDLASVYASQRFFFSSPGQSNAIIDSPDSPLPHPPTEPPPPVATAGGLTVQKYSSDPYSDFRRSMQEMIEARDIKDLKNDNWEYLHELLLCYLALNPKQTHKFIVGAFTDIVIHLMSHPPPRTALALADRPRKPGGQRQRPANPLRQLV